MVILMSLQQQRVIALGFFDGVHVGHAALLQKARARAEERAAVSCALTFDSHPEAFILDTPQLLLNTMADRADLMRRLYGIEEVIFAHFDNALMNMPWQSFLSDMLVGNFGAVHLVVGAHFHFGHRGEGNAEKLSQECARLGLGCDVIPLVTLDEITVSSTYIRKLIARGDMKRAHRFLGHPYTLSGHVMQGQKIGSSLLQAPTINFQISAGLQTPAKGVYVTATQVGESLLPSVTNVGVRPTFSGNGDIWCETSILNYDNDLYSQQVRVNFYDYLRPETKFLTVAELKQAVSGDLQKATDYWSVHTL